MHRPRFTTAWSCKTLLAASSLLCALASQAGPTLEQARARDALRCGVSTGLLGFSSQGSKPGDWLGMDVDICRAVAAAALGSADKVQYVPLAVEQRLTALREGRIDILSFNTTVTMARDTSMGLQATAVTYYDGQGFMVRTSGSIRSTRQLRGQTVCLQTGNSTEQMLREYSEANRLQVKILGFARFEDANSAYLSGRCVAITTDASGLAAIRRMMSGNPADHVILPELISKEPLGPMVRRGDDAWASIVKWVVIGLIAAEEHGITQANAGQQAHTASAEVRRMLGLSEDTGKLLGLDAEWLLRAIQATGNYGEIFARNVGPDSPTGLPRGLNALWRHGGLQYALPIR